MNSVLWFLPCLFSVEVVYWALSRLKLTGRGAILVMLSCSVLSILSPRFFPGLPWGLSKAPWYLLFFLFGRELFSIQKATWLANGCCVPKVLLGVGVVAYVSVCCLLPDPIESLRHWYWWPVYALLAMVGCFVSAWVAQVLRSRVWAVLGVSSMGIMLMHKFIVVGLELKVPQVISLFKRNVELALLGSVAVTVLSVSISLAATVFVRRYVPWTLGESKKVK